MQQKRSCNVSFMLKIVALSWKMCNFAPKLARKSGKALPKRSWKNGNFNSKRPWKSGRIMFLTP